MSEDDTERAGQVINLQDRLPDFAKNESATKFSDREVAEPALVVYQAFLDASSAVNMAEDLDGWSELNEYPVAVHTEKLDTVTKTAKEMAPFFKMVCDLIVSHWMMRRQDNKWRNLSIVNRIENATYPTTEPVPSDGVLPGLNIKQRTEKP